MKTPINFKWHDKITNTFKALMISIKPKWCAKIMNGEKTIEIRKNKALANAIQKLINEYGCADIYVYCSKDGELFYHVPTKKWVAFKSRNIKTKRLSNGVVKFKFRCYKVEKITYDSTYKLFNLNNVLQNSCLEKEELFDYLKGNVGYAIHINDLEIFDKPKELSEFKVKRKIDGCSGCKYLDTDTYEHCLKCEEIKPLTKAPQNFCYIEVE